MLLAADVGNTNTTFAVYLGDKIRGDWRLSTDPKRTGDEYAALLHPLFGRKSMEFSGITAFAISSVAPAAVDSLLRFGKKHLKVASPFVLTADTHAGVHVHYHPVSDVGPDRIANAVAAHEKYGCKVIVVDFGTAITLDAVSESGDYLGGAIAPGIQIALDALVEKAARLTGVQLVAPEKAIGDSTTHSVQSGLIFGVAGQVDALVDRFRAEMGGGVRVVATGGMADIIAPHSRTIEDCDELLTLEGIRLIYERAHRQ